MTASPSAPGNIVDWEQLPARLAADAGFLPIGIRQILIGAGVLDRLPAAVAELRAGRTGETVLLRDTVAKRHGDRDLHAAVAAALGSTGPVREVVLAGAHGVLHADEAATEAVVARTAGAAVLVTVGSGTLADLGKVAAAAHDLPHAVVQTAASVNGFADDQSVLLRSGVKRTVASRYPDVLVVDADVLACAPAALNRAGVGDLLSMFTAPADWLLADRAGFPAGYQQAAVDLVRPHGELLLGLAPQLAAADPGALARLAELLTLSGMSMGVSGCTTPSSGLEHLVSHLLDMHASAGGYDPGSHGSQVGVGSLVASVTWARVRGALAAGTAAQLTLPTPDEARSRVEAAFGHLDPGGRTAAECWNAYSVKLGLLNDRLPQLRELLERWEEFDARAGAVLIAPERLAGTLAVLGAPTRFADLGPGYAPEVARWAIGSAHLMRERFTVADLADLLGLGGPAGTEAVLSDLAALGAGR